MKKESHLVQIFKAEESGVVLRDGVSIAGSRAGVQ